MMKGKKNSKSEDDPAPPQPARPGKYRRKEPSPHVADYIQSTSIVRHPTAVKRSEQVLTSTGSSKSIRSLSVPSLHATAEKIRYSPPASPPKQRSKSVRVNAAKKASSFKKNFKKLFGSHLELDENGTGLDEQRVVGTYKPIGRPRSIGGSSDCSNSSTYTNDFSRCNSLRDSSRSRISHGNDSVFQGGRQPSCDSTDNYPMHSASGSTDSTLRQQYYPSMSMYRGGSENMQRSSSSTSLKNFGIQTKIGIDPRYHSVATDVPYMEEHGGRRFHRHGPIHGSVGRSFEDTESLWEESKSFTFVNKSVHPSDPQYRQVAEELMSVSPTHKSASGEGLQFSLDPRRMSEASLDPRRSSLDSGGMEGPATVKRNRSLPSTPITKNFATVHHSGSDLVPGRERSVGPYTGFLPQENGQSFPPGWEIAYTEQGLRYYLDHNSQSTQWEIPHDLTDKIGLPSGWEAVKSGQYGTYYVNHNDKTAIYQHPYHARPPPPYQRPEEEDPKSDRKAPARSHSHRSQSHRIQDPHSSLLRRSKSVRDQEIQNNRAESVTHERQLSVVTFVPPSPYQSKEIPQWLKKYVDAPIGSELDCEIEAELRKHSHDDLTGWDTMIKRLLKKGSEQIVKAYEYYRVAIQQEMEDRLRQRRQYAYQQQLQQQQQQKMLEKQQQQQQQHHILEQQQQQQQQLHILDQQQQQQLHILEQQQQQQQQLHILEQQQQLQILDAAENQSLSHHHPHVQGHYLAHPGPTPLPHSGPTPSAHSGPTPLPVPHPGPLPSYYQQHHYSPSSATTSTPPTSTSSSTTSHMAPTYSHQPHPAHSDLAPHGNGHHVFSPTATPTQPSPSSPQRGGGGGTHYHHNSHQAPPPSHHFPSNHHSHNRNDHLNSDPKPPGRYDTMIEKANAHSAHVDAAAGFDSSITSYSNGLRRVDSEGTGMRHGTTASSQSKVNSKGFAFRAVSADHVGLPRQGGSNFSELFETTKNVQETFV